MRVDKRNNHEEPKLKVTQEEKTIKLIRVK